MVFMIVFLIMFHGCQFSKMMLRCSDTTDTILSAMLDTQHTVNKTLQEPNSKMLETKNPVLCKQSIKLVSALWAAPSNILCSMQLADLAGPIQGLCFNAFNVATFSFTLQAFQAISNRSSNYMEQLHEKVI